MKLKKTELSVSTQAGEDFLDNKLARGQKANTLPATCSYDYQDKM